jgi:signal transduction histidine kinase
LDSEGISGTALTLNADADLLSRAVTNLMRNGFEANGWDGLLRIRSWSDALNWIVEIEDQGQGVSPEIQEKIFEPFFTTRAKGTGLGLAYTSQVVTAHGGRIEVRNSRQGGAIFSIVLPVSLT